MLLRMFMMLKNNVSRLQSYYRTNWMLYSPGKYKNVKNSMLVLHGKMTLVFTRKPNIVPQVCVLMDLLLSIIAESKLMEHTWWYLISV